jgi:hypothetical protein
VCRDLDLAERTVAGHLRTVAAIPTAEHRPGQKSAAAVRPLAGMVGPPRRAR